jgi:hypothetical protein
LKIKNLTLLLNTRKKELIKRNDPMVAKRLILKVISIFIFLLLGVQVHSQTNIIEGTIIDTNTLEVKPRALILIYNDSTLLGYDKTNNEGFFSLNISNNTTHLVVNALGYHKKNVNISDLHFDKKNNIYIHPEDFVLDEVVVQSKPTGIIIKKDTLIYNVASFTDSTEFNIEDVLKKLPGIEVLPSGSVRFNGKNIEKIKINGSDLFGSQYTIGTKNMRALTLDKVEVISNYQDNPVLVDLIKSEDVILNLKLNKQFLGRPSGSFQGGFGYDKNEESKVVGYINGFSIADNFKAILLSSTSNTSEPSGIEGFNSNNSFGSNKTDDVTTSISIPDPFIQKSSFEQVGLPSIFTDNSLKTISTLRTFYTYSDGSEISLNFTKFNTNGNQESFRSTSFFDENIKFNNSITSDKNLQTDGGIIDFQQKLLSKKRDMGLNVFFSLDARKETNNIANTLFVENKKDSFNTKEYSKLKNYNFNILFSKKLSRKAALQIKISNTKNTSPELLNSYNQDINNVFPAGTNESYFNQQIDWSRLNNEVRIILKTNVLVENEFHIYRKYNDINFQNQLTPNSKSDLIYASNDDVTTSRIGVWNRFSKGLGKKWMANVNMGLEQQKIMVANPIDGNNFNFKVGLTKHITQYNYYSFTYNLGRNLPNLRTFIQSTYLTDPLSFQRGSIISNYVERKNLVASYYSNNWENHTIFSVNAGYNFRHKRLGYDYNFINGTSIANPILVDANNNFTIDVRAEKFIPSWRILLKSELNGDFSNYQNNVNDNPISIQSSRFKLHTGLSTSEIYNQRLEFDFTVDQNYLSQDSKIDQSINQIKTIKILHTYTYEKWRTIFNLYRFSSKINENNANTFDGVNFKINFSDEYKKRKYVIALELNNLLSPKKFVSNSIFGLFQSTSEVAAVGPFAVLKFDYSF